MPIVMFMLTPLEHFFEIRLLEDNFLQLESAINLFQSYTHCCLRPRIQDPIVSAGRTNANILKVKRCPNAKIFKVAVHGQVEN